MDASKKQREPVAFKSLAELKRFIRPGVEFKTVSHANHADMVGLTRVVTTVQTVGFYSKIKDQLGVEGWEGVTVIDYDGIIPYAAEFTDLPMELEELNAFTKAARDIPRSEVPPPDHKARWFAGAALNSAEQAMASVMSTVLSRLNAFLDSELEQVLCFDSAIDAEKFASEKSAIFLILPEEDTTKNFMAGLMIQNLSRELFAVADENGGKLQNRAVLYCDEFGTMPPFDVLPLFSAGRSRRLTLVPIIQSLAQLEKNYGKEGSEIIQDNCQNTIFGGFAPNSQTAEVLSKALGNRTVLSGSVSRGKNDPSQSLQMMERPLLTPDELKSIPKGNFIVQKTGQHPMRTRLRLFLEWGITFEEPYIVPERADRAVAYANREDLERNLPQSNKAENADMRGAYAVSGRGGIAHEPAVDKPRRRGGKQMKTYGEEDL